MQIFSNSMDNEKNINYNLTKTFEKRQYFISILIFHPKDVWFGK